MAAPFLQFHHHLSKLPVIDCKASGFFRLADIVVLAKYTEKIAAAEKDSSGAMLPHQHNLFAKMRPIAGNFCIVGSAAETYLFCQPIDFASARA
jgi:hypothetical protein